MRKCEKTNKRHEKELATKQHRWCGEMRVLKFAADKKTMATKSIISMFYIRNRHGTNGAHIYDPNF